MIFEMERHEWQNKNHMYHAYLMSLLSSCFNTFLHHHCFLWLFFSRAGGWRGFLQHMASMTLPAELFWHIMCMVPEKEDNMIRNVPAAVCKDFRAGAHLWCWVQSKSEIQGLRILAERWRRKPGEEFSIRATIMMHPLPHLVDFQVRQREHHYRSSHGKKDGGMENGSWYHH